jgi:hypothetical protein
VNISNLTFLFKRLALIEAIILGGVLALCWIVGWHATDETTRTLIAVGVMIMAVGAYGLMGRQGAYRRFEHRYTETAIHDAAGQTRAEIDKREMGEGLRDLFQALLVGVLTLIIAFVIDSAFG